MADQAPEMAVEATPLQGSQEPPGLRNEVAGLELRAEVLLQLLVVVLPPFSKVVVVPQMSAMSPALGLAAPEKRRAWNLEAESSELGPLQT